MTTEKTAIIVSRAAGVVLIVIGGSFLLSSLLFGPPSVGWTSYSPLAVTSRVEVMPPFHDTYIFASHTIRAYFPSAVQMLAGVAMTLLSRPIGRRLARGLGDSETHN